MTPFQSMYLTVGSEYLCGPWYGAVSTRSAPSRYFPRSGLSTYR